MPLDTSTYSLALLRVDGRRWNELRRLHALIRTQNAADGSSYLEMGHTKVMCVVSGPSEQQQQQQQRRGGQANAKDGATVNVNITIAGFSSVDRKKRGRNDKRVQEMEITIAKALSSNLHTHIFPHSSISVSLHVLSQDGSLLAAHINATTCPDGHELPKDTCDKLASLNLCARGFLYSYCALIAYKSDFHIAKDRRLLPDDILWDQWKTLSEQVLASHSYKNVNPRYWYGELRLGRLNKVYMFRFGHLIRGYSTVDSAAVYMDLLHENFGILAAVLAYIVVVLTAMQVGLSVDRLKGNAAFQNASYGFTVFSVISPLGGALAILLLALPIVAGNWIATNNYEKDRLDHMGINKSENKPPKKRSREEEAMDNGVSGPARV
ncbi:hypothetical protein NQ176_g944 [Zarea fungicola]|uniref:Uncharacterized protein n=1 Tax=Zarea fungicola TaxID=93591 RepID=A0ACC1NVW1_9HYPO|nr:hypothetical protein NQ176_g944 [Lecanicillium fungicola]